MRFARLSETTHALRLERGDNIADVIQSFCTEQGIANAQITAIGSIEDPELAHYSIETRQFTTRAFSGIYEIVSLVGNIGLIENQPVLHAHVTISDETMTVFGGHLTNGLSSATLEVILTSYPSKFTKSHNESIGLNV